METNMYKTPSVGWLSHLPPSLQHPAIYVGDFNSHHPDWGHRNMDDDGEQVAEWAAYNDLRTTFDAKQRGTFHSARWGGDYTPDLCFTSVVGDQHVAATQTILDNFPRSQHRPSLIHILLTLPTIHCRPTPKKRWNFRKADWERFGETLDRSVNAIPTRLISIQEAYDRFQRAIFCAARKTIPRAFRPVYTPFLDSKCQDSRNTRNQKTPSLRTYL